MNMTAELLEDMAAKQYWIKFPKTHRKFRFVPGYEFAYVAWRKRFVKRYRPVVQRGVDLLYHLDCPITRVEIETINKCQNDCSFCPVNRNKDIRPPAYMSKSTFEKVIGELSEMRYKGGLYLSSNNEPLLDSAIVQRLQYAREKCPLAHMVIYTNGLLLTPEKMHEMMPYLDTMMLDNYSDDLKILPPIRTALDNAMQFEADKIVLLMRYKHDVLDTRGGFSPSRKMKPTVNISCTNPFSEMVITPTGSVSLCCQDIYNQHPMGNAAETSIKEVWHGSKFEEVRKGILKSCRNNGLQICRECDFIRSTPVVDEDLRTYVPKKMEGLPK